MLLVTELCVVEAHNCLTVSVQKMRNLYHIP